MYCLLVTVHEPCSNHTKLADFVLIRYLNERKLPKGMVNMQQRVSMDVQAVESDEASMRDDVNTDPYN